MKNLTAIEKLDNLLNYFANDKSRQVTFTDMSNKFNIDAGLIREILDRIVLDGFVKEFTHNFAGKDGEWNSYSLTFNGRLFYDSGGYKTKALKDANESLLIQIEIDRHHTLDDHLKNAASRLNQLTLWLTVGTGALALIEVIKFFVWLCSTQTNS